MFNKLFNTSKKILSIISTACSSKQHFQDFLMQWLILRFEPLRRIILKFIQIRVKKSAALNQIFEEKNFHADLASLNKNGYLMLNKKMPDSVIESIKTQVVGKICCDNYNKQVGTFKLEEAPDSVNIAGYLPQDLVKIPEVMQIANDPEILSIVQAYFACKPTITGIEMWWSFAKRKAPQFAQFYHRDFDGIKFLKLFIYLTDVTKENGAHVYVEGSAGSKTMRRPSRIPDEKVQAVFPAEKIKYMSGEKGTIFLEDTFGIHKGSVPNQHDRLLLQIEYGLHPLTYAQYQPISADKRYDAYINRLFLSPSTC